MPSEIWSSGKVLKCAILKTQLLHHHCPPCTATPTAQSLVESIQTVCLWGEVETTAWPPSIPSRACPQLGLCTSREFITRDCCPESAGRWAEIISVSLWEHKCFFNCCQRQLLRNALLIAIEMREREVGGGTLPFAGSLPPSPTPHPPSSHPHCTCGLRPPTAGAACPPHPLTPLVSPTLLLYPYFSMLPPVSFPAWPRLYAPPHPTSSQLSGLQADLRIFLTWLWHLLALHLCPNSPPAAIAVSPPPFLLSQPPPALAHHIPTLS